MNIAGDRDVYSLPFFFSACQSCRKHAPLSPKSKTILTQLGDYPDVDPFPAQLRNPYKKYDDQQDRRNRDQPLSVNDDLYDIWSPDRFTHFKNGDALKYFTGFLVLFFGGAYIATNFVPEKSAIPREFPYEGLWKESGGTEKSKAEFAQRVDSE